MVAAAVWFVLGLVLLALGGDSIVKAASGLAQRFGASPFVAGLLLVAFGTSLPELVVNVRAFAVGAEDLALGNAVGSNIVNIGLTLGLAALAAPLLVRARLLSPLLVLLAVAGLALIVFGLDGVIARWEGGVLLLGFVGVLLFLLRASRRETEPVREAIAGYAMTRTGLLLNGLRVLFAGVALYYGARWIVDAAPVLGAGLGWSPLLVGLLPVAIGTALPEVAAAIAAARRGQGDMVLGHVIGSSLFNLLVVVGGMAALRPIALPESFVKLELPATIAFVLVLYPMLRGDLTVSRREGGILLVAFVGWVVLELALIGG
ncbi:sodium:calcium antiporter [Stenotrophomonas sp.]|uniref:sodium:calcium antiporter n=1 Tax=Stenotrophomonas sp. TaxID=69392 RepID=UPI00289908B0|nr:sodium:calcium antiporter [Stenotrophomonas sp.]